jgi:beta-N-acetylhexosaminidase
MDRRKIVPTCIAAGCDMFLFANDIEEDISYVKSGIEEGLLTTERVDEAVTRILGMKAHLRLNNGFSFPEKTGLDVVGCKEHHRFSEEAADRCITLVKDTESLIPVNPSEKRNVFLVYSQTTPNSRGYAGDEARNIFTEELERAGFNVTQCPNFYDLELKNGVSPMNFAAMTTIGKR